MSSETKTQVTFGKVEREDAYTATTAIYLRGKAVGYISTESHHTGAYGQRFKGNVRVSNYTVHLDTCFARFTVEEYGNARSALAAAKRYAKETLYTPNVETRVEEINAEIKSKQEERSREESAIWRDEITREILELERERADLLYGTVETPAAPAAEEESVPTPPAEAPRYTEEEQQLTFNLFKHDTRDLRVLRVICSSAESGADKLELIRALREYLGGGAQSAVAWLGYFTNVCPHIAESGAGYTVNVTAAQVTLELVNRGAETPVLDETLETRNPLYHLYTKRGESWEYNSSWYDLHNRDAQRAALEARGLEVKEDFQACKDGVLEGKHNGAYVYDIPCNCPKCTLLPSLSPLPGEEEALEPLVKGLPEATAEQRASTWEDLSETEADSAFIEAVERELAEAPGEEEARVIRVTPPQVDALRALGYEVKSCKLRLYPSQVEELLERLYAERETRTRGARRVYTSLIERVSSAPKSKIKRAKGAARAFFRSGDLRIEYSSDSAHRQLVQLVDAAESTGLISAASARALRASCTPPAPHICRLCEEPIIDKICACNAASALPEPTEEEESYTGSSALARFFGDDT